MTEAISNETPGKREIRVDAEFLLSVFASSIGDRRAVYCSAPITSGRRYVDWVRTKSSIRDVDHATSAFSDEHRLRVITPNQAHAQDVMNRLRHTLPLPVIDPTAVPHIPDWKQLDWLRFWERVIDRFAVAAVFVDDWQFSYGCTHEFAFVVMRGLPAFDENGQPLRVSRGRSLIEAAIREVHSIGGSTSKLEESLASVRGSSTRHSVGVDLATLMALYREHAS